MDGGASNILAIGYLRLFADILPMLKYSRLSLNA